MKICPICKEQKELLWVYTREMIKNNAKDPISMCQECYSKTR